MPPAAKPTKRKAPAFKPPRPTASTTSRRPSAPTRQSDLPASSSDEGTPQRASTSRVSAAGTDAADLDADAAPPPTVPPELLTRLIHHHLNDGGMKMDNKARALAAKYVETFVREALARAKYEKDHADGGAGRVFLEVGAEEGALGWGTEERADVRDAGRGSGEACAAAHPRFLKTWILRSRFS